jgi:tRNA dimethylallyltransferase
MSLKYDMIAVVGPTASGKTAFAAHLAKRLNGEVISADSRQVYRRMNIGTGKDYDSYHVEGIVVPVHLVDIAEPGYKYSLYEYQRDFTAVYSAIKERNRLPVLCGGSGMYIDAVTRGYRLDKVPVNEQLRHELSGKSLDALHELLVQLKTLHNTSDIDTRERALRAIEIEYHNRQNPPKDEMKAAPKTLFLGIKYDRETERQRITGRLKTRLQLGLIEEVRGLLNSGITAENLTYYGLEYRYVTQYLLGEMDYNTMFSKLNSAIHQFSKRQGTWFRKMEKQGTTITWLNPNLSFEDNIKLSAGLLVY